MDQDRSNLNPAEENPSEEREPGDGSGQPSQTDQGLPPHGSTGVADEGEDRGFGERPAGSEDGSPGSGFEPIEEGRQEGDQGPGSGGD